MHIKHLISAAAVALVAGIGAASAAEQFTTLDGFESQAMTPQEMGAVVATAGLQVFLPTPASGSASPPGGGAAPFTMVSPVISTTVASPNAGDGFFGDVAVFIKP